MKNSRRRDHGVIDAEDNATVDRYGAGASAAGINERIGEMYAANPIVVGTWGATHANTASGPRPVRGGGTVVIGPGEYLIEEPIVLGSNMTLVLDGAHLYKGFDGPTITTQGPTTPDNTFGNSWVSIQGRSGAGIHGEGFGGDGIFMGVTNWGTIEGLTIENHGGTGVRLGHAQHIRLESLFSHGNGEYGFRLGRDPRATTVTFGSDACTSVRCQAQENGIAGMWVEGAAMTSHLGFKASYHENGPGILVQPGAGMTTNATSFHGFSLESNKWGAHVLEGGTGSQTPRGTGFYGGYWLQTDGMGIGSGTADYLTLRQLVNQGVHTVVDCGSSSFNNQPDYPNSPTFLGTGTAIALIEQDSTRGSVHVRDMPTARGTAQVPYICDESGNIYPEDHTPQNAVAAVSAIGQPAAGVAPFPTGGWFGPGVPNV